MLNNRTALLLSLINALLVRFSQGNLMSVSFKDNAAVDEYVRKSTKNHTGITLLKSQIIQKAILGGQELIRFKIDFYSDEDKRTSLSLSNNGHLKVLVKCDDVSEEHTELLEIIEGYKSLCGY